MSRQYDWCKKLNDAGFHVKPLEDLPFRHKKNGKVIYSGAINCICIHDPDRCPTPKVCEVVDVPQLDELIEFVDGPTVVSEMYEKYYKLAHEKLL